MNIKKYISTHAYRVRDPFVTKLNGKYYSVYALPNKGVGVNVSDTIEGLNDDNGVIAWVPKDNTMHSKENWAPELHIINNKCYIYVACDDGNNYNHRMYVLENNSNNPLKPYKLHGQIGDDTNRWAIDGTIIQYKNKLFMAWSGWEDEHNVCQNIYIAEMSDPFTISSKRRMISTPTYDWEKIDCLGLENVKPFVNEGPFSWIDEKGRLFIIYSASGCWNKGYRLAALLLNGTDPMKDEWIKQDHPFLFTNEFVSGPGHCSMLKDDDGNYIFFHGWEGNDPSTNGNDVYPFYAKFHIEDDEFIIE
ncbi:MAG: glycoside hydrolase family 43 protein [Bacilli bacterium]|nr:glycoside hydrolase family 43 protein [Bacilli bacterium]